MSLRPNVHVAAICGSLRGKTSYTMRLLEIAAGAIEAQGATVDLVDLAALDLPFREGPNDTPDHPGTKDLQERTTRADGILLGSPEYHNSMSGALKNALDLLGRDELGGKLFGLMGVSGGAAGAINTLGHLRYVVRGVGGWSLPAQVSVPNASSAFGKDGPVNPDVEKRICGFAQELVRFTRLHLVEPQLDAGLIQVIDENR